MLSEEAIRDLPPELSGALTFHLPMELAALRDAGAAPSVIDDRVSQRMAEAYRDGLVDPPMYRWAQARYRSTAEMLCAHDFSGALSDVAALADGLAGAAFHGLIRLGYGCWQNSVDEITNGLAYLRCRRQVLVRSPASFGNSDSAGFALPDASARVGVTVFDLLNMVAGSTAMSHGEDGASVRSLTVRAVSLARRNPSSFVAIHAVSSLHALCEFHRFVQPEALHDELNLVRLAIWWDAYTVALRACTVLVESVAPEALTGYDNRYGPIASVDELVRASVQSAETHDVKLAVALRRLVSFEVLSEDEAVELGIQRLCAAQLL